MSDYDDLYDEMNDDADDNDRYEQYTEHYRKITYTMERKDGALIVTETVVTGTKRPGQDWGEADFDDHEFSGQTSDFIPEAQAAFEAMGRKLKDGETLKFGTDELQRAKEVVDRWQNWQKNR